MNSIEQKQLKKLIKEHNVEDNTMQIRKEKNSIRLKEDIVRMRLYHTQYKDLKRTNRTEFDAKLSNECSFLMENYPEIYTKLKNDQIDYGVLMKFVELIARIERGECDEHNAAFEAGKLLKSMYIDTVVNTHEGPDTAPETNKGKNISWAQYNSKL